MAFVAITVGFIGVATGWFIRGEVDKTVIETKEKGIIELEEELTKLKNDLGFGEDDTAAAS